MPISPREALLGFGWLLVNTGRQAEAEAMFSQALASARIHDDTPAELAALQLLGQLALVRHQLTTAADLFREVLRIGMRCGDDAAIASSLHNHGELALSVGEISVAVSYFTFAADYYRQAGNAAAAERTRLLLLQLAFNAEFA